MQQAKALTTAEKRLRFALQCDFLTPAHSWTCIRKELRPWWRMGDLGEAGLQCWLRSGGRELLKSSGGQCSSQTPEQERSLQEPPHVPPLWVYLTSVVFLTPELSWYTCDTGIIKCLEVNMEIERERESPGWMIKHQCYFWGSQQPRQKRQTWVPCIESFLSQRVFISWEEGQFPASLLSQTAESPSYKAK